MRVSTTVSSRLLLPPPERRVLTVARVRADPYFPGGAIGMARVLYDGLVEYEDGTPATTSQMAKDVVTFLSWASEPEHDDRKKMGLSAVTILSAMLALSIVIKKQKFAPLKSRKITCEFKPSHRAVSPCAIADFLSDRCRQPSRFEALKSWWND